MAGSLDGVNADLARQQHQVTGAGITVAVIDSGCRATHSAFSPGRVSKNGRNFAGGDPNDTTDTVGHGTAIAGIIAGNISFIAPSIAPRARILPLKVFSDDTANQLTSIRDALDWLLNDGKSEGASVVCLSIGDKGNYPQEGDVAASENAGVKAEIAARIQSLRALNVPTIVAAGNRFRCDESKPGMAFPAILPGCLSVGALFRDSSVAKFSFGPDYCDAEVVASRKNQVAPFSQRLPRGDSPHFTRLFAPGVAIVSLGNAGDGAQTKPSHGTSLAAPFVAGVVALLQELHKKRTNSDLPSCDALEQWLLHGGDKIVDDAGVDDNVTNTGATFKALNALGAFESMLEDIPGALQHLA